MADSTPTVSTEVAADREPVATDEIGGKHHQKVKVEFGADDSATQVSAADPLPVGDEGVLTQLQVLLTELGQKLEPGGQVTVANPTANPETGLAKDATLGNRYSGGKTSATATVTASGDTTIVTPASGQQIRLYWISAINDPDESTTPLIKVKLGATELYRAYAVAHWEMFTGAVDAPLVVNLDSAASVAVTAHYEQV